MNPRPWPLTFEQIQKHNTAHFFQSKTKQGDQIGQNFALWMNVDFGLFKNHVRK
jgi:hypothetical protein